MATEGPDEDEKDKEADKDVPSASPAMAASPTSPPPTMQFASLYVGDLHPDVSEAALYEAFQAAGTVASCRVCRDSVTRKSLGYGYVNYYNVADAEKALETLNYTAIKGRPCRVMWSQRDANSRKNTASNVFVKNLDVSIDNKALHDTFSIFGNILSCKVATDLQGKSKGYGFVHYETEEAAKSAIARVNGMKIGESTVYVGPFIKREELEKQSVEEYTNLYVKHMPPSWDEAKVESVFGEFGEMASSVIMNSDEGRRFALINFKESQSAKAAVAALHKKDMRGEVGVSDEVATDSGKPSADDAAEASAEAPKDAPAETSTEVPSAEPVDDAEKPAAEAAGEEDENHPAYLLYVQRAQTREERAELLKKEREKNKGTGKGAKAVGTRLCVRNLSEDTTSEELKKIFGAYGTVLNAFVRTEDGSKGGTSVKCKGFGFVVMSTAEEATTAVAEAHLKMVGDKPLNVGLAERRKRGDKNDDGAADWPSSPSGSGAPRAGTKSGGRGGRGGRGEKGARLGGGKGRGKAQAAAALPGALPGALGGMLPPYPYGLPPRPGMVGTIPALLGGAYPGMPGLPPPLAAGMLPPQLRPGTYSLPPALAHPGQQPLAPPLPGTPAAAAAQAAAARSPMPPVPGFLPAGPWPPALYPRPLGALGYPPQAALHPFFTSPAGGPMPPGVVPPGALGAAAAPAPPPLQQTAVVPPLSKEALAALPPQAQKQHLGERLYAMIFRNRPDIAGKITGMLLELNNKEITSLLENEGKLNRKVEEAVSVLNR